MGKYDYVESVFSAKCDCGCGIIKVSQDSDKDINVSYYVEGYYSAANGIIDTIWHRIKFAFSILRGKEFRLYDILLQGNQAIEFKKNLASFVEKSKEN